MRVILIQFIHIRSCSYIRRVNNPKKLTYRFFFISNKIDENCNVVGKLLGQTNIHTQALEFKLNVNRCLLSGLRDSFLYFSKFVLLNCRNVELK